MKIFLVHFRMLVPRIDINKDGYVDDNELTIWIRHKLQPWTVHEDIDAIFHDIDADYDNQITWNEYMENAFGFTESGEYTNLLHYIIFVLVNFIAAFKAAFFCLNGLNVKSNMANLGLVFNVKNSVASRTVKWEELGL